MEEHPVNKHLLAPTIKPHDNKQAQMIVDLERYVYADMRIYAYEVRSHGKGSIETGLQYADGKR
ncbi:hypothetical protein [Paenibacillus taiwanensis]|uniref:hypothetical protein n=1 Tax=Paenibacillus taiwanensis TaxID=401638 RepID=UPI0004903625|nr:hypothetical protein [Paenibacillus taiwanensis]